MRYRVLVFAVLASLTWLTPSALAADNPCDCCTDKACTMPCCKDEASDAAAAVLMPAANAPARQIAVVWFKYPVLVGDKILMGKYIIEHDNDRMAQGLPCTHIYAANKPQVPVVKFHCVHLEGEATDHDLVTLKPMSDPSIRGRFSSFQFKGDTAGHGMPNLR